LCGILVALSISHADRTLIALIPNSCTDSGFEFVWLQCEPYGGSDGCPRSPTHGLAEADLEGIIAVQPTAGFDPDGLPLVPTDADITDGNDPVHMIDGCEVPVPDNNDPVVEFVPDDDDTFNCMECAMVAWDAFVVFLMVVLFVPLVAIHLATHIVHRLTGFIGATCLSVKYTEYNSTDGRLDEDVRGMQNMEECMHCFSHTIGYVLSTVSWILWYVAKMSLVMLVAINNDLFQIEWLSEYGESYEGATLPTCETGGTEYVDVVVG
jgi:hypothetical protein